MRYAHDCDRCKPLGVFGGADLYYCDQGELVMPTLIARNSSEPSDYQSGLAFAATNPALQEAKARAVSLGYLAV